MRSAQSRAQRGNYKSFPRTFDGNPRNSHENVSGKILPWSPCVGSFTRHIRTAGASLAPALSCPSAPFPSRLTPRTDPRVRLLSSLSSVHIMAAFRRSHGALVAALPLAIASVAVGGPDWEEVSDAGSTLGTAQAITTSGAVNTISGKLSGGLLAGDYQDCFLLEISNPSVFSLTTSLGLGSPPGFNPMMFLFRVDNLQGQLVAKAVLANNDKSPTDVQSVLQRQSNDGSGTVVTQAGLYLVAISGFGSQPINAQGQFLFNQEFLQPGVIAGPNQNPQLSDYVLAGWSNDGSFGNYTMTVTGVTGTQLPAPGALALLALGGLVSRRRQR